MTHYIFKTIVIGDGKVGKTSLIRRYVHERFDPHYKKTIGVAHAVKRINIKDTQVTMTLWDTGGQELFDCVRPQYYRGSNGVLVVYDVTNRESFDHLDKWLKDLSDQCGEIPIILVANKIDLTNENVIPREEGERYALKNSLTFYETSAKTGKMVVDVLEELARLMLEVAKEAEKKKTKKTKKKNQ